MGVTRREFTAGAAALASLAPTMLGARHARADVTVGAFTVTSLSDGYLTLPTSMLAPDMPRAEVAKVLGAGETLPEQRRSPLNVTLIRDGKDVVLVDVGSGSRFMDSAGTLLDSLDEAGVAPEEVTKVFITHAHPDHVWGLLDDFDDPAFPEAEHFISGAEWDFWMADDILSQLPEERHAFAVGAQRNLSAIEEQISRVKPGDGIAANIEVVETGGHTPGHCSLALASGSETLMVLGDALTHPILSFAHPEWHSSTDQEPDRAVATRKALLDRLHAEKSQIIGYHLPNGGLGRVNRSKDGYQFEGA